MTLGSRRVRPDKSDASLVIEQSNFTGRVSYWHKGERQSVADANGVSIADYIHAMYEFLRQARARDVLMIGCGGGTLATMLQHQDANVTIVDIDPRAFELARRYFHLSRDVACVVADGAAYLRQTQVKYDAIVLDAFDGDIIPKQLTRPVFFAAAKAHLAPANGIYLENILVDDDDDRRPDERVRLLQKTWTHVRLLDCDGFADRNAVIAAGAVRGLRKPSLTLRPARGAKKLERDLASLQFRKLRD